MEGKLTRVCMCVCVGPVCCCGRSRKSKGITATPVLQPVLEVPAGMQQVYMCVCFELDRDGWPTGKGVHIYMYTRMCV